MPNALDHVLFLVLAVLFPLRAGTFGMRRLRLAEPGNLPAVRRSVYRQAIALQWGLALATFALWWIARRSWNALGVVPHLNYGLAGVFAGLVVVAIVILRQRRAALADDEALGRLRGRMEHLEVMLPHTRDELARFYRLSLTAGVCEEILYRGYLIWYFSHYMGIYPAAAAASLVFGVGHSYQGWRGVLTTGLVGAFLAAVYLVTGSLYPGMLIHALMDVHSGGLMQAAYAREAALAAEEPAPDEAAEDAPAEAST